MEWSKAQALAEEGSRVDLALSARRSEKLQRLFNFLLEVSRQGRQPGESEIAVAIRGISASSEDSPGSTVRVYMSRLRKMLDQHYAVRPGPRLVIPRGEYRIELLTPERGGAGLDAGDTSNAEALPPSQERGRQYKWSLITAVIACNILIAAIFWVTGDLGASTLAKSRLWQPLISGRYPTAIIIGDHFLFGERNGGGVEQINRDFSVSNEVDFRNRILAKGGSDRFVDLDLAYTSSNLVFALRSIWTALRTLEMSEAVVSVSPASRLDPEIFQNNNIIYVGPLDGTGRLLGNVMARASAFELNATDPQLLDKKSGRRYQSDIRAGADTAIPLRDYGYIASLPGPSNNRIIIISGLGDAGIAQMADLAGSSAGLAELASKFSGKNESFEALYQVRTMYSQGYARKLVAFHSIAGQAVWDGGR